MNALTDIANLFWRRTEFPFREVFRDDDLQYSRCIRMIRGIYLVVLYQAITGGVYRLDQHLDPRTDTLQWPLIWMAWVPWEPAVYTITAVGVTGAIAALLFPRLRAIRIWAFLGIFALLALRYSYTGVQHRTYTMLTLAFFFALLPAGMSLRPTAAVRRQVLRIVWCGMTFVFFVLSMAGFLKFWGIFEALLHTDQFVLDFSRVPGHLLARAYMHQDPPALSEWLLDRPFLATTGMFVAYYFELMSLLAAFRPNLQRWWILATVAFHFSTELTMKIFFVQATLVLIVLFLFSPFSRPARYWRSALRELPLFGAFLAALLQKIEARTGKPGKTIVYCPGACAMSQELVRLRQTLEPVDSISFASQDSPEFARLREQHPYLANENGLAVYHRLGDEESLRLNAEGTLWLFSGCRGKYGLVAPLLLVPSPLADWGYRIVARRWQPQTDAGISGHGA